MKVAGVVLAAGGARRMAGRLKQLLPLDGRPLLQHAIDALTAGGVEEIVVVLGAEAERVGAAIRSEQKIRRVMNPDWRSGQASSLAAGLGALDGFDAAIIMLADQPGIVPDSVRAVRERLAAGPEGIVRARYDDGPGHPVGLHRRVWPELRRRGDDRGARGIMDETEVALVRRPGPTPPDIDTPAAYRTILNQRETQGC